MKKLYLFGAGGLGREVSAMLAGLPEWEFAGFFDDDPSKRSSFPGQTVHGTLKTLVAWKEPIHVLITIGDPATKKRIAEALVSNPALTFPSVIHPSAVIFDAESIQVGKGAIISAGVKITTHVVIGDHVLINLNCTVGHDTVVGDYSSIMPGVNLAGGVNIGTAVMIGSGTQVINHSRVGNNAVVGAGASVIRDVAEGTVVVGVPAKQIR